MSRSKLFILSLGICAGTIFFAQSAHAASTPKPGDLIKTKTNATVFLVDDSLNRTALTREAYVVRYGNNWSLIKVVVDSQIGAYDYTGAINTTSSHASGSVIIYRTDKPEIYLLENGFKRPFVSWDAYLHSAYANQPINWVGTYEVYPTGSVIK